MQTKIGAEGSDNKGMESQNQPSTFDWIKLLGVFVLSCVVAFDIFAVRIRSRELARTVSEQKYEMDELRASFEKQIQELKEQINQQRMSPKTNPAPVVRCSKCDGKGEIEIKKRCEHCGGSGKIRETHTRWKRGDYIRDGHYSTSSTYFDCPYCLPGPFRGGGSKGYTIEKKVCPMCNGRGRVGSN